MVFNREKLFYCFKNIWENLGKLNAHILSIYKSFNTWSCSKYWSNPSKTLSGYFKLLKYLQRKYSPKIPGKFYHVIYDIFDDLAKPHALKIKKTSSNPVKTLSVQNQIWTTLHCQVCPFDLNFCGHVEILKWWHYTKWCINENRFAWLNLGKAISADF